MRSTTTATQNAMEAAVTRPVILLEIMFSTPLRLVNSLSSLTWDGRNWSSGRMMGGVSLRQKKAGGQEVTFALQNGDNAMSALVLSEGASGKAVNIYQTYGEPPYSVADVLEVFSGVVDGVPRMDDVVTFNAVSAGMVQWSPRINITEELFPHIIPAGKTVTIGGQKVILEADRSAF